MGSRWIKAVVLVVPVLEQVELVLVLVVQGLEEPVLELEMVQVVLVLELDLVLVVLELVDLVLVLGQEEPEVVQESLFTLPKEVEVPKDTSMVRLRRGSLKKYNCYLWLK